MSTPSFSKEDFAKWNQTTSVFYLPKRLVGKSKVTQLRSELVKTIGESKVSVVQALPGLKFRVCFVSSSFRQYYDINDLNFRGLTITHFPAYEEVKSVFVDWAPPQMPEKSLYMMAWLHKAVSFRSSILPSKASHLSNLAHVWCPWLSKRLFQLKFAPPGFSFDFATADSLLLALRARRWAYRKGLSKVVETSYRGPY